MLYSTLGLALNPKVFPSLHVYSYTIFLFTKWGGVFLISYFIVNKSMLIMFLGCCFCALKTQKLLLDYFLLEEYT